MACHNQRFLLVLYRVVNFAERRMFQGFEYAGAVLEPA
jgi:hypothetical protein